MCNHSSSSIMNLEEGVSIQDYLVLLLAGKQLYMKAYDSIMGLI